MLSAEASQATETDSMTGCFAAHCGWVGGCYIPALLLPCDEPRTRSILWYIKYYVMQHARAPSENAREPSHSMQQQYLVGYIFIYIGRRRRQMATSSKLNGVSFSENHIFYNFHGGEWASVWQQLKSTRAAPYTQHTLARIYVRKHRIY